eukprot:UN22848
MTSNTYSIENLTVPMKSATPKTLMYQVSKTHYTSIKEKLKRQSYD